MAGHTARGHKLELSAIEVWTGRLVFMSSPRVGSKPDQGEYRVGVGMVTRPVPMPDDVADPAMPKASGRVVLPLHVHWWEPLDRVYDLDNRADRRTLYAQVLTDGTPDDVRWFIDVEQLVDMWGELLLPSHVESLWKEWLHERGFMPRC